VGTKYIKVHLTSYPFN